MIHINDVYKIDVYRDMCSCVCGGLGDTSSECQCREWISVRNVDDDDGDDNDRDDDDRASHKSLVSLSLVAME